MELLAAGHIKWFHRDLPPDGPAIPDFEFSDHQITQSRAMSRFPDSSLLFLSLPLPSFPLQPFKLRLQFNHL
jgi:hypothetical protein